MSASASVGSARQTAAFGHGRRALPSASADGIWHHFRLAPECCDAQQAALRHPALVVQDARLVWLGELHALPPTLAQAKRHDAQNQLLTPGLIDCHTHLVYGGQRADEFAMRLAGASYADIAKAGGGIVASMRATRAASEQELFALAAPRLEALLAEGVCAIEIKSGYGLCLADERKQLRVARQLGAAYGVTVKTTFLGAHALPPEFQAMGASGSDAYIAQVCLAMMPALAAEGLIDAVDVFCENIGFSLAQTETVFKAAQALNLPVKLHAEQLSNSEGAALAARYQALSCDHIENLSAAGICAMQASGSVAVLLPGAYYFLRDTQLPPVAAMRAVGLPIALSTDHNPGTSPTLSLLLMLNMAATLFGLTVPEALAGVTRHAARALGLSHSHGSLIVGELANFVLWPLQSAAELVYWLGQRPRATVVRQGRIAH